MSYNDYAKETKLRAKRTPLKSKPKATRPGEIWGIDMTKIKTEIGWVYIIIVLDWYSKKVVGKQVGLASKTEDWLGALEEGINKQFTTILREMLRQKEPSEQ